MLNRRTFIKLGAAAAFALAGASITHRLLKTPQISREEYDAIVRSVGSLKNSDNPSLYKIDKGLSAFVPGSNTLVVYLPDTHNEEYAKRQRIRISALDEAIDFTGIGLEGLVGELDNGANQKISERKRRTELFWTQNSFDDYIGHFLEYPVLHSSDNEHVRLQKTGVQLQISRQRLISKLTEQQYEDIRDLLEEISSLHITLPTIANRLVLPKHYQDERVPFQFLVDYMGIKEFGSSSPRFGSPGLLYSDLETIASKFGLDTHQIDTTSIKWGYAFQLQLGILYLTQQLDQLEDTYGEQKGTLNSLADQDEVKTFTSSYLAFVAEYRKYIKGMAEIRDSLLQNAPEPIQREIHALSLHQGDIDKDYKSLTSISIVEDRSQVWIENLQPGKYLLIGGRAHTDSVINAAKKNKCSIICLNHIDLRLPAY